MHYVNYSKLSNCCIVGNDLQYCNTARVLPVSYSVSPVYHCIVHANRYHTVGVVPQCVLCFPCRIETRPNRGGRGRILTDQQELAVVNLVRARNDIRLTEIQQHIIDNVDLFNNVEAISLPTIARILKRHQVSIKQIYRVPFERNTDRVKQLRAEYVQVCSVERFLLQYERFT